MHFLAFSAHQNADARNKTVNIFSMNEMVLIENVMQQAQRARLEKTEFGNRAQMTPLFSILRFYGITQRNYATTKIFKIVFFWIRQSTRTWMFEEVFRKAA